MCLPKVKTPRPAMVAAVDNSEALAAADMEERLRKRRAGAAANILTGPTGIPAGRTLGGGIGA